ncbi:putative polysaccharide biosynthesis protein [Ammoniphilus resinae]|uniref:PST family polysaccharide transporter n=1 Tax=Ammoniphilus resinae TaxID=861532 RepID=A0ABS4GJE1_9BACL|nr:PST family polysaccharide transporter [Ammoniphilus resinae]
MAGSSFLKGALILSAAAFISKLLGVFYVIPLKHLAGDEGLALYQAVFPIYNTLLILSVSGIPIALSKLISEKVSSGQRGEVAPITRSAIRSMIVVALLGFAVLFMGSKTIALWIGDLRTTLSIQAIAYAMLLVPFVAVLRGYFYGFQLMQLSAVSQVIEQFARVFTMIFLVYWFLKSGKTMEVIASGAAFSSVAGVSVAFLILVVGYLRHRTIGSAQTLEHSGYIKKILAIAIPVSLSTLMIPVLGMVDSLTIINMLKTSGEMAAQATKEFGVYSRGVPIVQFAAFYATGLSVAVVPALSSARTNAEKDTQIRNTLKISLLIGIPASIGMMLIAQPLNVLFYGDGQGSNALAVLAVSTLFLSLAVSASGILQGLGKASWPAIFLAVGIVLKVVFNLWLTPIYGILGAAYSTVITYALIALVSIWTIRYFHPSLRLLSAKEIARWILPSLLMGGILILCNYGNLTASTSHTRGAALYSLSITIGIGIISYVIGLMLFRVITKKDFQQILQRFMKKR